MLLGHQAVCGCDQSICPEQPSSISCFYEYLQNIGAFLESLLVFQLFPVESPFAIDCSGYQHCFGSSLRYLELLSQQLPVFHHTFWLYHFHRYVSKSAYLFAALLSIRDCLLRLH